MQELAWAFYVLLKNTNTAGVLAVLGSDVPWLEVLLIQPQC